MQHLAVSLGHVIANTVIQGDNTSMPIVFEDVAPVVPVRDLQAALERYRRLGFEVRAYGHGTGYGYSQRGAVSIHLSEWDKHDPKRTGAVAYLYVSDADAVRAEWASCGVEDRLGEVRNTDYGMREFGSVDTDGTLHRVGSKLR
jgi:catechol 2,3-dioxygenase-like lactoylglutathione lyase family enzyme